MDDNPQPGRRDIRDEIRGDKRKEETVMLSSENVADLVAQAKAEAAAEAPAPAAATPEPAPEPAAPAPTPAPSSSGGGIPPIAYIIGAVVIVALVLIVFLAL